MRISFSSVFIQSWEYEALREVIRWLFLSISSWLCCNLFACRASLFPLVFYLSLNSQRSHARWVTKTVFILNGFKLSLLNAKIISLKCIGYPGNSVWTSTTIPVCFFRITERSVFLSAWRAKAGSWRQGSCSPPLGPFTCGLMGLWNHSSSQLPAPCLRLTPKNIDL